MNNNDDLFELKNHSQYFKMIEFKNTIKIIFITFIFLTGNTLFSREKELRFDRIAGLSNPSAISIYQDSKGFLWIGTWGGLNRYDGYSFKHYLFHEKDSHTISSQGIIEITEDKQGRLWLAGNQGLNYYQRKEDKFYRFYHNESDSFSLIGNDISCMYLDSKGRLWIGTFYSGICYLETNNTTDYRKERPKFIRFSHRGKSANEISHNYIQSVFEDSKGRIWLTTAAKVIDLFNEKEKSFEHYRISKPTITNKTDIIELWQEDKNGNFWFTTRGAGIFVWKPQTDQFIQYASFIPSRRIPFDIIRHLWISPNDGTIWIASDGKGLFLLDPKTNQLKLYEYQYANPDALPSNAIYRIYQDRSNNIWLATFNGELAKVNWYKTTFNYIHPDNTGKSLNHKSVLCFLEDKDGLIWIGTDGGGLNVYNPKTKNYSYFLKDENNPNSLSSNAPICLAEDSKGQIWIGTYGGGLNCYNKKTGVFKRYLANPNNPNSLSHNNVWAITVDKNDNVWLTTIAGTLNLFIPSENKFYHFHNDPNHSNSYLEGYPTKMLIDSRNWLWISTTKGLAKLDLNKFDIKQKDYQFQFEQYTHNANFSSPPSNNLYAMAIDKNGNIWLGNDEGWITEFYIPTMQFNSITDSSGLYNRGIRSMIFDLQNRLWIGSNNGLWMYNIRNKTFRQYISSDGIQGDIFGNAIYRLRDGTILIGGPNGFNWFNPEHLPYNYFPPMVTITGFKIFGRNIQPNTIVYEKNILVEAIEETKEITLPYWMNYFSIEFAALDFTNPSKNKYLYKLEGFDKTWLTASSTSREAIYANLKPGKYIFKLKASNNDGVWQNVPTNLIINIDAPWWQAIWFKMLGIILGLAIIIGYFEGKILVRKRREALLNDLVTQRTHQLIEINTKLQEQQAKTKEQAEELKTYSESLAKTNALLLEKQKVILEQAEQLKQSNEQLKLLNATKDKFFSIIAHDLRNPFNVLIGLSDIMQRNYDKLSPDKIQKYSEIISLSAKSGYNLLENLLQWSRSQTGNISYSPVKLQLSSVIEETLDLLAANAEKKGVIIQQMVDSNFTVFADESMLLTILRNLISNAIKFSFENGKVVISAKTVEGMAQISISDNGIGIPADKIDNLFRIDVNYTTKGTANESGTGLGLLLCKEFVERHNGKIWVESQEGKGSTFYFTVPLA